MTMLGVQAGHRAYRAALLAFAYPGRRFTVCEPGSGDAVELVLAAVWGDEDGAAVGAPVTPGLAVVGPGPLRDGLLAGLPRGTEDRPEDGATLVIRTDGTSATEVRLTGPGVDRMLVTTLPVTPSVLDDRAAACSQWPLGVDLLMAEGHDTVVGLPRTTVVEVLG